VKDDISYGGAQQRRKMMTSVFPIATVSIATMSQADVINVYRYCEIRTIIRISSSVPLHCTVTCASLEWTLVTPYKPEMASKMTSLIDHREEEDDDGFQGQQAQVCQWCRRGGGGVHTAAEEAKDE
jgi:hypothetical protein